ncbi:MAG: acyl-CoA dehydrogenase family protein [Elusimicrobiaceae bacterium]|nr:acyl-CoA dehydrogenase family protein [Elusimicrobiaceae bacterium]
MAIDTVSRNLMLESLKKYAERRLPYDTIRELDCANQFPAEILREMYDPGILGVHLLLIPREHGGLGGSTVDIYRVCHALARIDLGVATSVFATFLGSDPLRVGGTPAQQAKWMTRIARQQMLVAYGATEADAGSDLVNLRTRAERVMKDGKLSGYRLTGNKQWISNGGVADLYTILAMAPDGPSWFLVERGTPGFEANKHEDKYGIRLSNTAGLSLDEVFVPAENLIGEKEGQGLLQAQAVFGYTRLMVAAFGLGAGEEAIETAIRYSQQRIQGGGPLSQKQGYTHKLIVPHEVKFEAARAYIDHVARRLDTDAHGLQTEGAIAKYYATEAGNRAAEDAIQALGGYGYTKDFPVEKIKRDVKITCIYEGTNEIMEMTIYRGRWQEHLKSRGAYYAALGAKTDALHAAAPDVGADSAALGLKSLAVILEQCREQKLTRQQYTTFKLGELIAKAEVAMVFSESAADKNYGEGVKVDRDTLRAMARVCARETAFEIALEGMKLVLGGGTGSAATLAQAVNLTVIEDLQRGIIADKDLIAAKLNEVYRAK